MHAYIFDIDGTLARSNDLDERLFARAIEEVLGVQGISTDWASYAETTDEAITRELIQMHRASDDAERLVASTRSRFIEMVRADLSDLQRTITPVPGVPSVLDLLAEREGASVAMATGGWPESAKLKLGTAPITRTATRSSGTRWPGSVATPTARSTSATASGTPGPRSASASASSASPPNRASASDWKPRGSRSS